MRVTGLLPQVLLLLSAATQCLAASWSFTDATVSISSKGTGVGGGSKEKLSPGSVLNQPLQLRSTDTLRIILTAQENKAAKRPHQAYILLKDSNSNLDVSYPLSVKENGKATISLSYKDLPAQFQQPDISLETSLIIASFGSVTGYNSKAFSLNIAGDGTASAAKVDKPLRYGKLPEIHHTFRAEARSPNFLISAVFAIASFTTVPILLGAWLYLGGNINHLSKALNDAPVSHAIFVGSIIGLEGILFLYYAAWNLFQTLPALAVVGVMAYVSGSRALTEVQGRRLAGLR